MKQFTIRILRKGEYKMSIQVRYLNSKSVGVFISHDGGGIWHWHDTVAPKELRKVYYDLCVGY